MSSKKPKDQYSYKDLKKTVGGWLSEAETSREKALASTIAKMSATGAKPGSPYWESQLKHVEEQYRSNLQDIYRTETYKRVKSAERDYARKEASRQQFVVAQRELQELSQAIGTEPRQMMEAEIIVSPPQTIRDFQQEFFGEMGMLGDNTPNKIWWEGAL